MDFIEEITFTLGLAFYSNVLPLRAYLLSGQAAVMKCRNAVAHQSRGS